MKPYTHNSQQPRYLTDQQMPPGKPQIDIVSLN